jgi:hypothetical protein
MNARTAFRIDAVRGKRGPGLLDYRLLAVILFLVMVGLYVVFG